MSYNKRKEVIEDYVHVFVSAHLKISPSYIVKMLKGIGSISEDAIKKYVANQKQGTNSTVNAKKVYIRMVV